MQVLLHRSIANLGKVGEVVKVKNGYARNYLIPHGYASLATTANVRRLEKVKEEILKQEAQEMKSFREMADRMKEIPVSFVMRAHESGHLFGSLRESDLVKFFATKGFDQLNGNNFIIREHIKQIGTHEVLIRLHPEVEFGINVQIDRLVEAGEVEEKSEAADGEGEGEAKDADAEKQERRKATAENEA